MRQEYKVCCECRTVEITMSGTPRVIGNCHCEDCRTLLNVPYYALSAWSPESLQITRGAEQAKTYQHPTLDMSRVYCPECGETVYNTNAMGWKIVPAWLTRKNYNGKLPAALTPDKHFWYAQRVVNIDDDLPKHE